MSVRKFELVLDDGSCSAAESKVAVAFAPVSHRWALSRLGSSARPESRPILTERKPHSLRRLELMGRHFAWRTRLYSLGARGRND